jgi:hypothetical protein
MGGTVKIRKLAILAAGTFVALSSNALAKKPIVISIVGTCDVLRISVAEKELVSIQQDAASCEGALGSGLVLKNKELGKAANIGLVLETAPDSHFFAVASYPFVSGGSVDIYISDGKDMELIASTTYTVEGSAARKFGAPLGRLVKERFGYRN